MRTFPLALVLLLGCTHGRLDRDLAGLRAEIADLERAVPADAPLWVREGPSSFDAAVEDGGARIPSFVYNHVVSRLEKMTEADLEAMAEPDFDLEKLLAAPGAHRGRVYSVHGPVAKLNAVPLPETPGEPQAFLYSGALFVGNRPVLFHLVTKPDVVYLGQDAVDFRGVFVKLIQYTARNGESVDAPFFICRSLRKYY